MKIFGALLWFSLIIGFVDSQQVEPPPEIEAPLALFDTKINDAEVELLFKGSWTAQAQFGLGGGWNLFGYDNSLGLPEIQKGFIFSQVPDFVLSLWLMKRYYTEITIMGSFEKNTFLVGYKGEDKELLQYLKFGNSPMTIPSYAGMTLPAGKTGAPGLSFGLKTTSSKHDFLARYEDNNFETKIFRGERGVETFLIPLDGWIRRRFFDLKTTTATQIEIWVQDQSGSLTWTNGQKFRQARSDEASINESKGLVTLSETPEKTVLVKWFGQSLTLLTGAGSPTIYELQNVYPLDNSQGATQNLYTLTYKGSGEVSKDLNLVFSPDPVFPTFTITSSVSSDKPFSSIYPDLYVLPGPGPSSAYDREITITSINQNKGYQLGPGVLKDSLEVTINGRPTRGFQFEMATGVITLDGPIFPSDEIKVLFQREKVSLNPNQLFIVSGNKFDLGNGQDAQLAATLRWNLQKNLYTTGDNQSLGNLTFLGSWNMIAKELEINLRAQAGLWVKDTTGIRRVLGMEEDEVVTRLNSSTLRPSGAPFDSLPLFSGLNQFNRGQLLYRNLFTKDENLSLRFFGSSSPPSESYGPSGSSGPYLSSGDPDYPRRAMVLEYIFAPGEKWVGAQVFPMDGQSADWKDTGALNLVYKTTTTPSGTRIFLQIGSLGEDWDGSGRLQSRPQYTSGPVLNFRDSTKGFDMSFPLPENSEWGNDGTNKGWLWQDEDSNRIITRELTVPTGTLWNLFTIELTPDERRKLARVNSWRFLVINDDGLAKQGVLLVGALTRQGSTFYSPQANVTLRQTNETAGLSVPVTSLGDTYPEIRQTFQTSNKLNQALEIRWPLLTTTWDAESFFSITDPAAYKILNLYFRFPVALNNSAGVVNFQIKDAKARKIQFSFPITPSSQWRKVSLNISNGEFTLDGINLGKASIENGLGSLTSFKVSFNGNDNGLFYLDEVYFSEALGQIALSGQSNINWTPSWYWRMGDLTLGGFKNLKGEISGSTSKQGSAWVRAEGQLGPIETTLNADVAIDERTQVFHGGYELTAPFGPIKLYEKFQDRGTRLDGFRLELKDLSTVTLELGVEYLGAFAQGANLLVQVPNNLMNLKALWTQTRTGDLPSTPSDWWWVSSQNLSLFQEENLELRKSDNSLELKIKPEPVGIEGELKARHSRVVSDQGRRMHEVQWGLGIPIKIGENILSSWFINPHFNRSILSSDTNQGAVPWNEDWYQWGQSVYEWSPYLVEVPFFGVWNNKSVFQNPGPLSGTAVDTLDVTFSRPRFPNGYEFIIPTSSFLQGRFTQRKEFASFFTIPEAIIRLDFQADNLWGSKGVSPIFLFYELDSFKRNLSWLWKAPAEGIFYSLLWEESWDFFLTQNHSTGIFSSLGFQKTPTSEIWNLTLKPKWSLTVPWDTGIEWPRYLKPKDFKSNFMQTAGMEIFFQTGDEGPLLRKLLGTYEAIYTLGPMKTLRFFGKMGQLWTANTISYGLETGLEMIFKF